MPQMGESIAEGTIVRWIKKVGDNVDRDEPLFEISTDKVDAEIPSPAAGTLLDIAVKEGETVAVNSVVATIGAAGEAVAVGEREKASAPAAEPPPGKGASAAAQGDGSPATSPSSRASSTSGGPAVQDVPSEPAEASGEDLRRQKSSPLVRRIAKEHGVDLKQLTGTGIAGRVTKQDILGSLETPAYARTPTPASAGEAGSAAARATTPAEVAGPRPLESRGGTAPAARATGGTDEVVPMSVMRRKIAEHMIVSQRTSAHVYSVFEVNYSKVDQIRKARKDDYESRGVKLTFTSFIAKAAVDCLRRHKVINASIDGDNVVYKHQINLGIAVALDGGLIVPVVKHADELNILGLSRAIADVAERARAKKLNPDEVHGGTFTITNPGNFGAQFGLPIINQPQVAILGVGTIEKRPVVIDDMIGIRLMGYLTLGYDHRLVDGAVADQFMADIKKGIESFDPSQV
jgi:pyruvate dehydrogenase E2 component (dihydrolipoamide acetyltransferase)